MIQSSINPIAISIDAIVRFNCTFWMDFFSLLFIFVLLEHSLFRRQEPLNIATVNDWTENIKWRLPFRNHVTYGSLSGINSSTARTHTHAYMQPLTVGNFSCTQKLRLGFYFPPDRFQRNKIVWHAFSTFPFERGEFRAFMKQTKIKNVTIDENGFCGIVSLLRMMLRKSLKILRIVTGLIESIMISSAFFFSPRNAVWNISLANSYEKQHLWIPIAIYRARGPVWSLHIFVCRQLRVSLSLSNTQTHAHEPRLTHSLVGE